MTVFDYPASFSFRWVRLARTSSIARTHLLENPLTNLFMQQSPYADHWNHRQQSHWYNTLTHEDGNTFEDEFIKFVSDGLV